MPETLIPVQPPIGLAKSAPIPMASPVEASNDAVIVPPVDPQPMLSAPSFEGIPVETIRYFGMDIGKLSSGEIEQLKDIHNWSKPNEGEDTIGGRLQKLKSLETKLGAPKYYETKLSRLWSWVKMDSNISELRKRQSAFEV